MKVLTPIKAIKAKCKDCSGGSVQEARLCQAFECPIWPYRNGKRPEKGKDTPGEPEA